MALKIPDYTPLPSSLLIILVLALSLGACAADSPRRNTTAIIDTLDNGAVRVQNHGAGLWEREPGARWEAVHDLRIGRVEGEGPDLFGQVGSVLADALGRIWVVDAIAQELRVFESDGQYIRTVGGPGEGLGEFRRIGPVFLGPDDEIWVEDLSLRRWEIFDTAGVRVGGHRAGSSIGGAPRQWLADGRLAIVDRSPAREGPFFLVYRPELATDAGRATILVPEDTFQLPVFNQLPGVIELESPDGRHSYTLPVPFSPMPGWLLGSEGDLWVVDGTSRYEIRRQSLQGDTLLIITRDHDPVPIPDSVREGTIDELLESLGGAFSRRDLGTVRMPANYPPFDGIFAATDGTLWVRRALDNGEIGFDLFSADGRYLGRPGAPSDVGGMRIQQITDSWILAVDTDELGVEYVVRLRLERSPPR